MKPESDIFVKPGGVRPSPTMSADQLAKKAQSLGIDIITFTLGDLEPKPAEDEIEGWKQQLKDAEKANPEDVKFRRWNKQKYAPATGTEGFRAAAAFHHSKDTGIEVTADHVRVGNGGKGTLTATFRDLEKQESPLVFVAAPGWPTNYDVFPKGTRIAEVDTDGRGLMTPAQLRAKLEKYPNPSIILINCPTNPTGENYTPEEREELLKVIKEAGDLAKDTVVVFDDPYGRLVFDREPYDIGTVLKRGPIEKELFDAGKVAVIRTTSKEWGMADTRVGWIVTKNTGLLATVGNAHASEKGGISGRAQDEAMAALHFGDKFVEQTVAELKEKRQMLIEGASQLKYTSMEDPKGTIYGWPDFSALKGKFVPMSAVLTEAARHSDVFTDEEREKGGFTIKGSSDLMRYLGFVVGICPVEGQPFHAPGLELGKKDMHIRFTFCGDKQQLAEGIARLQQAEQHIGNPQGRIGGSGAAMHAAGRA